VPCAAKTYSAAGSPTNACTPCTDTNAVSNSAFTACVCAAGYSPTSAGPNPSCGANSAPYKGYLSISGFTGTTCAAGAAMNTTLTRGPFTGGCTKMSNYYTYQSCADANTMKVDYFMDAACTIGATYPTVIPLTCSADSNDGSSALQTCMYGDLPAKSPATTGNNILITHYSASATCTGAVDTLITVAVAKYGGCVVSGTASYSYSCKNNLPSRTDYTDTACSVGAKTSGYTAACMADTGSGATGSMLVSCTGGTSTSGAASTAAGVVAAVAAVAAAVALA